MDHDHDYDYDYDDDDIDDVHILGKKGKSSTLLTRSSNDPNLSYLSVNLASRFRGIGNRMELSCFLFFKKNATYSSFEMLVTMVLFHNAFFLTLGGMIGVNLHLHSTSERARGGGKLPKEGSASRLPCRLNFPLSIPPSATFFLGRHETTQVRFPVFKSRASLV